MKPVTKGLIALIIAVSIWGSGGLSVRYLVDLGLNPQTFLFVEFFMVSILMFILFNKKIVSDTKKKGTLKWLILLGVFAAVTVFTFVYGMTLTTIANSEFLHYTMPLWVFIIAFFWLGEKISKRKIFALVMAFIGMFLVFKSGFSTNLNTGDVLSLISAFGFAGSIVVARKLKDLSYYTTAFFGTFIASLFFFVAFLFNRSPITLYGLVLMILFGLLYNFFCILLYYYGLTKVEATVFGIVALLEAVFAAVFAWIFLGEVLGAYAIVGGVLVLLSSGILVYASATHSA